jgi:hypothetical protein
MWNYQVLSTIKVKQLIILTGDGMGKPRFSA